MGCNISKQEKRERMLWVDSLKGIGICGVVWVHVGGGEFGNILDSFGRAGAYWVEMFLILTVYLSCCSLARREKQCTNFLNDSFRWLLERIWKLTPLYYLALVVYLICIPSGVNIWLGSGENKSRAINFLLHLCYLHDFFPYYANSITWVEWYIGVMVIYLVIIPVLFKYTKNCRNVKVLGGFLIILSLGITCVFGCIHPCEDEYIWEGWIYTYSFIVHLPTLTYGIWLYVLRDMRINKVHSKIIFGVSIVMYMIIALASDYYGNEFWVWIIRTMGVEVVFFMLILSGKISDCLILNNRIWQIIGQNSYAIYLFHFLLVYIVGCLISDTAMISVVRFPVAWKIIKFALVMAPCFAFSIVYEKHIGGKLYQWGQRKIFEFFVL